MSATCTEMVTRRNGRPYRGISLFWGLADLCKGKALLRKGWREVGDKVISAKT